MPTLVNGFILGFFNLLSILTGYYAYSKVEKNQLAVQLISACITSILTFIAWTFISGKLSDKFLLKTIKDYFLTLLFSIIFGTILFITLCFITQGYVPPLENVISIWMFQIPTNILIMKLYQHFTKVLELSKKLGDSRKTDKN